MDTKFDKGSTVIYGKNGICIIEDIKTMDFGGQKSTYYILKPNSTSASTLYVPVDKENLVSKMRPVMSRDEVEGIFAHMSDSEIVWPEVKNERNELFSAIVSRADVKELIMLVKCIYEKKKEKANLGKKLSGADEMTLKSAQKLISEELAYSLNCSAGDVSEYIKLHMK